MSTSSSRLCSILPLAVLLTSACGWVDSTGRQAGDVVSDNDLQENGIPVTVDGNGPTTLSESNPVVLVERRERDALLSGGDSRVRNWLWRAVDDDSAIDSCRQVSGFDPAIAETMLTSACSSDDCGLSFEEFYRDDATAFRLTLPALRAPLAARFRLSASDESGNPVGRDQLLCGLAVNEAPIARDDRYAVSLGETLSIMGGSDDDLLANDDDDDDVRNEPLKVDTNVTRAPVHASAFELDADGGFRYTPDPDLSMDDTGRLEDSFAYTIDDGLQSAVAQVVVVISDSNSAPMATADIPAIDVVLDEGETQLLRVDLAPYFRDDQGDALSYTAAADSLPPSGNLRVNDNGLLNGIVDTEDAGEWLISLTVSDGRESIEATVDLTITVFETESENRPPVAEDIDNRRVRGLFGFDVTEYFDDPDGDPLSYSASGLPNGTGISQDGFISGLANARNEGTWFVVVTAEDPDGASVSDGFRLVIDN